MGPFKAGFYQTFAALFGASLKKEYHPEGEDRLTERVVSVSYTHLDVYKRQVNNYVKKPFVPDELDAHIHAILNIKAGTKSRNENEHYKLGRFTLDAKHATLYNDETEEKKMLTVREAKICLLYTSRCV